MAIQKLKRRNPFELDIIPKGSSLEAVIAGLMRDGAIVITTDKERSFLQIGSFLWEKTYGLLIVFSSRKIIGILKILIYVLGKSISMDD